MIETENADEKVKRQQPRLLLALNDTAAAETKVTIRYLARGLSWAPSYKIDISDPKSLALQAATASAIRERNSFFVNFPPSNTGAEGRFVDARTISCAGD